MGAHHGEREDVTRHFAITNETVFAIDLMPNSLTFVWRGFSQNSTIPILPVFNTIRFLTGGWSGRLNSSS